ncbi:nucleoside hydrolase [Bosea sp. BK604]|uniref:nucleoside hydrolase n=1 Tax=Bosea sp. BK604 TaxID=2512180 RepID=UPI001046AD31|nr:nucleoside hydrolase [Bosea sp. BK604]TCR61819.1 purine nucleosidase/pyrimidine-specific ribonucleoside hydrolase [Bosea sp. BK604]
MTRVLIDCDPGHDDAMAILYAAKHLDLVAITTVHGNAPLEDTTRNALSVCTLAKLNVPISAGADRPLVQPKLQKQTLHGKSGIDGADLPVPDRDVTGEHAALTIIREARRAPGELVLIAVGPMTNVALALRLEPKLPELLKGLSIMGGSTTLGNVTATAEFNLWADPEAAAAVFDCGIPVMMAGLNITRQALIREPHVARMRASGGAVGKVMGDLQEFYARRSHSVYGLGGAPMHDSCAVVPFVHPDLIKHRECHVHMELGSPQVRGTTICDLRTFLSEPAGATRQQQKANALVALEIDGDAVVDKVVDAVVSYDS